MSSSGLNIGYLENVLLNIFQGVSFPFSFQQEDYADCGGVSGLNPSLWSIIGIQCTTLAFIWQQTPAVMTFSKPNLQIKLQTLLKRASLNCIKIGSTVNSADLHTGHPWHPSKTQTHKAPTGCMSGCQVVQLV